ncbi:hypothetical protein [Dongshaea marina]|uniref:hypothetical protein n=1 Tax=Dongshaea marina TaxID=2047966 RepID=UPI000D3E3EF1|nr:hypothetical protein [Dongshaea marina]
MRAFSYLLDTSKHPRADEFWGDETQSGHFDERFKGLREIGYESPQELNIWCECYLNRLQWRRLKTMLRMKRHRKAAQPVTISINQDAYKILKGVADKEGCTLSEAIEILHKD